MKARIRLVGIALLLIVLVASFGVAFASHFWAVTSAACNADNGVVSVQGYLSNTFSSNESFALDAKGNFIGSGSSRALTIGTYSYTFRVSGVKPGDNIMVGDFQGGPWIQVACGSGPVSPEGFVLRQITCNTPVYQEPGGSPVGSDAVTAGQTWFVSPEPEEAADGSSWTAIWTGGLQIPFIPTSCVGGAV